MAQDDGGAYLFMLVQEHAFAGDGDACEAAALVASGFGDEDDAGLGQARRQVVTQLLSADGRGVRTEVTGFVVFGPGIEDAWAMIGAEFLDEFFHGKSSCPKEWA